MLCVVVEGGKVLFVDCVDFVVEVVVEVLGGDMVGFVVDFEMYEGVYVVMVYVVWMFGGIDILINGVGGVICMWLFVEFELV